MEPWITCTLPKQRTARLFVGSPLRRRSVLAAAGIVTILSAIVRSALASGTVQEQIALLLTKAQPVGVTFSDGTTQWTGQTVFVGKLANGVVLVKTTFLALDTDGASKEIRGCDSTAQRETALLDSEGKPTDANAIPYFVLPWCGGAFNKARCRKDPPYRQLGLDKGDLAAVIVGGKIEFAIAADLGPEKHFGEGSVELHRRLGHETVGMNRADPKCAKNESLDGEVIFVVFPGSNKKWLPMDKITKKGSDLLRLQLGGVGQLVEK
jgi:Fungal chitosanase of glycosyl hydrolase group 75